MADKQKMQAEQNEKEKKLKKTETPHDRAFKKALRSHTMLVDFLRQYLPPDLFEKLDLDALKIDQNELLFETVTRSCDVVIEIPFKDKNEKVPLYFVALLEHQSTVDRLMPIRIITYCGMLLLNYKKKYPKRKLPIIMPVVVYTGRCKWTVSTDVYRSQMKLLCFARPDWV